jgi:hypothetical protein
MDQGSRTTQGTVDDEVIRLEDGAIRPFQVGVLQEDLDDLRRRLAATRFPEKEIVADQSQGVPLATMRELVRYSGLTVRLIVAFGSRAANDAREQVRAEVERASASARKQADELAQRSATAQARASD